MSHVPRSDQWHARFKEKYKSTPHTCCVIVKIAPFFLGECWKLFASARRWGWREGAALRLRRSCSGRSRNQANNSYQRRHWKDVNEYKKVKGTVLRDCTSQFFPNKLTHQGPWLACWNLFKYGFDFADIFAFKYIKLRSFLHVWISLQKLNHMRKYSSKWIIGQHGKNQETNGGKKSRNNVLLIRKHSDHFCVLYHQRNFCMRAWQNCTEQNCTICQFLLDQRRHLKPSSKESYF